MKLHLFSPQREGRIVAFLTQLFFQSIKLTQPPCLCEKWVSHSSSPNAGNSGSRGDVLHICLPPETRRCLWESYSTKCPGEMAETTQQTE